MVLQPYPRDMSYHEKKVRILLVGEGGVGKTSMIYSLVFEDFYDQVPPKCEEITIPPEVTPVNIATEIVDFSAQEQTEKELAAEIEKASVICIVYAIDNEPTIDKISTYWLPFIHQTLGSSSSTPVILVGNKLDLVEYSSLDSVVPLMNQYKEIEVCVECSAKRLDNLSEIFYYAQKTVLYPVNPIYYPEERDLSETCKLALQRVFKLCDVDNDGVINDQELSQFQTFCFGSFLLSQTLDEVKYTLKSIIPDGVLENGITVSGFMFLLTFFVQRSRHELIWIVLRKFGYNNTVQLSESYLYPEVNVPKGSSVELSPKGYTFFQNLFERFDEDKDGCLKPSELEEMLSICEIPPKWAKHDFAKIVHTNDKGWITLQGFLSMWTLVTSMDLKEALRCLAVFGYMVNSGENSQISALTVTKDKRIDLNEKQTSRNVFLCRLIGPQGAGKSAFMRKFLNVASVHHQNPFAPKERDTSYNGYIVNSIMVYGQKKYLIIKEIDVLDLTGPVLEPELFCDVSCLMYDQSDSRSFQYIAQIYTNNFINSKLPILIVASKSDLSKVKQKFELQPDDFCSHYNLTTLHKFSDKDGSVEVFDKLATMAAYPNLNRLVHLFLLKPTNSWMARNMNLLQRCIPQDRIAVVQAGIGAASIAMLGFFLLKFLRTSSSNS